jgi:hypothetical protein
MLREALKKNLQLAKLVVLFSLALCQAEREKRPRSPRPAGCAIHWSVQNCDVAGPTERNDATHRAPTAAEPTAGRMRHTLVCAKL